MRMSYKPAPNTSLGAQARALEDFMKGQPAEKRRALQLAYLDEFFEKYVTRAMRDPFELRVKLAIAETAAAGPSADAQLRAAFNRLAGIDLKTFEDPSHPSALYDLPLDTSFFGDVRAQDINALPAWQSIHRRARAQDYAVTLTGFSHGETGANGSWRHAQLAFDSRAGYEKGRRENPEFYPKLEDPPPLVPERRRRADGPREKRPPRWHLPDKK